MGTVAALASAVAGALGFASGLLEERLYLLFFYPALLGFALGIGWALCVHRLSLRPPSAAGWATALALIAWGGLTAGRLTVDRQIHEAAFRAASLEGLAGPSDARFLEEGGPLFDLDAEQTAWFAWLGAESDAWVPQLRARLGKRLEAGVRTYGVSGYPAPPWVVVFTWLIEVGLMWMLIGGFARAVARTPRCPDCGEWMDGTPLGRAAPGELDAALERARAMVERGDATLVAKSTGGGFSLVLERCPRCPTVQPFVRAVDAKGRTVSQVSGPALPLSRGDSEHL